MSRNSKYFCTYCGKQLIETRKIYCYDGNTGIPVYEYIYTCPSYRWYRSRHDVITLDEAGKKFFNYLDKDGLPYDRF